MVKSLTKTGNSVCLVIDKALLQMMNLDAGDQVELQLDGRNLIVTPANPADRKKFLAAMKTSDQRYNKAYKQLAK